MKTVAVIFLALSMVGCTERTELGECIGLFNDDERQPDLNYQTDKGNVVLGVLLFETAIVPVVVFGWETKCPTSRKLR